MSRPGPTRLIREDPSTTITPFAVMDAPELAAFALLEHAIDVACIALLAQHIYLLDSDPPVQREPLPGGDLTKPFFARARALTVVLRRYRAALAQAANASRDDGFGSEDENF
jgi:hypothetical protein